MVHGHYGQMCIFAIWHIVRSTKWVLCLWMFLGGKRGLCGEGIQSVLLGHDENTKKWGKLEMRTCQFVITEIFHSKFEGI